MTRLKRNIPLDLVAACAAAFVLRPLAGLLAIGAVFAALFKLYRRKGAGG